FVTSASLSRGSSFSTKFSMRFARRPAQRIRAREIGRHGNDGGENEGNHGIRQSRSRCEQDFQDDYSDRIEGSRLDGRHEDLSTYFRVWTARPFHPGPPRFERSRIVRSVLQGKPL